MDGSTRHREPQDAGRSEAPLAGAASAPVHPEFRLPRSRRLRRPAAFEAARRLGRRFAAKCFIVNWLESSGLSVSQVGVITSRKVGSAVVRNRARRLLREVFRRHQHALRRPMSIVLVARPSIAGWRFPDVEREYLTVLRRNHLLTTNA